MSRLESPGLIHGEDVKPDTIDELVRACAAQHGDKPMVIDTESRMSYAELDETTRAMAASFVLAGVTKGTRVGLIMPNSARWVTLAAALTRVGAILVPLSTLLSAPELVAQLRTAAVQLLVAVEEFRGHRYLDGLRSEVGLPVWTARCGQRNCLRCTASGPSTDSTRPTTPRGARRAWWRPWPVPSSRATRW